MPHRSSGRPVTIWRDGRLVEWESATIHVMSHVVHYGSSVFEGIRCYATSGRPAVFRLPDHIRRLLDSCRIHRIPMRYSLDQLVQACLETLAANNLFACYLRPIVARTGQQMGVLGDDEYVETFIIPWQWDAYLGAEALAEGVDVCVSSWRRAPPDSFPALAKAGGNYLNSQLAKAEAQRGGYVEAILLDAFGYVSEGSGENLFLVRGATLFTPPPASSILCGITRDSVITIARDLGYEVREQVLPREALYTADELFFTGTAAEITPIRSVDRITVGSGSPGPITRAVQARYLAIATGGVPDRHGWLNVVRPSPFAQQPRAPAKVVAQPS